MPHPYPDELLYSFLARWRDRVGRPTAREFNGWLFDTRKSEVHPTWTRKVGNMANKLTTPYNDPDFWVQNHTLLPLWVVFTPVDEKTLKNALTDGSKTAARLAMPYGLPPIAYGGSLRWCPCCADDDQRQYGETYWHRVHQVPGLKICGKHGVYLEESTGELRSSRRYLMPDLVMEPRLSPRRVGGGALGRAHSALTESMEWLLENPNQNGVDVRFLYREALLRRGLVASQLRERVWERFSESVLQELHFDQAVSHGRGWFWQRCHMSPPIWHAVLIHALDYTMADYFALAEAAQHPFGSGPWPCQNRSVEHFGALTIPTVELAYRRTRSVPRTVGTFRCACGYAYRYFLEDESSAKRRKQKPLVVSYGERWDQEFRHLWNDGVSRSEIQRRLHISDVTIERTKIRLGLWSRHDRLHQGSSTWAPLLRQYWADDAMSITAIAEEFGWSVFQVRKRAALLDLPDRANRTFALKGRPALSFRDRYASDPKWQAVDRRVSSTVAQLVGNMRQEAGRPQRITEARIWRMLRSRFEEVYLRKLPRTAEAVSRFCESAEDFAVRRLRWRESVIRAVGRNVTPSSLGRFPTKVAQSPAVQIELTRIFGRPVQLSTWSSPARQRDDGDE